MNCLRVWEFDDAPEELKHQRDDVDYIVLAPVEMWRNQSWLLEKLISCLDNCGDTEMKDGVEVEYDGVNCVLFILCHA